MQININNPPVRTIPIGRMGENNFREIMIDVSSWLTEYPNGKISVIYRRPDGELYPVVVNARESPIVWRPTATDTAVPGAGAIEARVQVGDMLGKSCTIPTKALPALGAPGDIPATPAPDWTQTVADDAARAEAAREAAEKAAKHASGQAAWMYTEIEDGCLVLVQGDADTDLSLEINDAGELEAIYE